MFHQEYSEWLRDRPRHKEPEDVGAYVERPDIFDDQVSIQEISVPERMTVACVISMAKEMAPIEYKS